MHAASQVKLSYVLCLP